MEAKRIEWERYALWLDGSRHRWIAGVWQWTTECVCCVAYATRTYPLNLVKADDHAAAQMYAVFCRRTVSGSVMRKPKEIRRAISIFLPPLSRPFHQGSVFVAAAACRAKSTFGWLRKVCVVRARIDFRENSRHSLWRKCPRVFDRCWPTRGQSPSTCPSSSTLFQ